MRYEKQVCSGCSKESWIVNKTYKLCKSCNEVRLKKQRGEKPPPKPIRKVSEKMNGKLALYHEVKEKKRQDQLEGGYYRCFFCNKNLEKYEGEIDCHHTKGRDGDLLTDYRNLFFAHRGCHTDYHSMSSKQLMDTWWYRDFLSRIKKINKEVYRKELDRMLKGDVISMESFLKEY